MVRFFKFLDVRGAQLTLANRTFKHANPSDFNDTEDLTVQSIFPEELETALQKIEKSFIDIFIAHLRDPPTCDEPLRAQVALLQTIFRANPNAAKLVRQEYAAGVLAPAFDIEHMRRLTDAFILEINDFLQQYRVLCVTTRIDAECMWCEYAEDHRGIALRIEPNVAKDSKFRLFRPITYRDARPPLYEDSLDFVTNSLFGDQKAKRLTMLNKIIYAKTRAWEHENEYRLAIPTLDGEAPWDKLPYHPEEITELYMGLAMDDNTWVEIVDMALAVNRAIIIYQAGRGAGGELQFTQLHP